jgi:hypothetical protein
LNTEWLYITSYDCKQDKDAQSYSMVQVVSINKQYLIEEKILRVYKAGGKANEESFRVTECKVSYKNNSKHLEK